jgi:hypothetical protein
MPFYFFVPIASRIFSSLRFFRPRRLVSGERRPAMEDDGDALGAPSALAAKGQGDTQTRRDGDGALVAPAGQAALGTNALQAAMDEDGDALGPPSASASKGRGAGSCCDGDAPPHDGNRQLRGTMSIPSKLEGNR